MTFLHTEQTISTGTVLTSMLVLAIQGGAYGTLKPAPHDQAAALAEPHQALQGVGGKAGGDDFGGLEIFCPVSAHLVYLRL